MIWGGEEGFLFHRWYLKMLFKLFKYSVLGAQTEHILKFHKVILKMYLSKCGTLQRLLIGCLDIPKSQVEFDYM